MKFFPHSEGYINYTAATPGGFGSNGTPESYNYVFNYTDHLGNIRLSYGLDPSSGVVKILEENHYYPFGLKHANYNSDISMYSREEGGMKIKPLPPGIPIEFKYKYNGKEWQDELGLNVYNYGFRNYDPAIGRWMNVDPMAERRNSWTDYAYCLNNPVLRLDPNGLTDFTFDKKTGDVKQVGDKNDDFDRILKTKSNGKIKYKKNGNAKVAVGGIEQGILQDGQNFKNEDQIITMGGKGQPSINGVKSFTLNLSEYLGKEIRGYSYSSNGSGKVTDIVLGKYNRNSEAQSFGSPLELAKKYGANYSVLNIVQQFHTHPRGQLGATQTAPEYSTDVKNLQSDKRNAINSSFIVLYRELGELKEYDYTHNYNPNR